MTEKKKLRVDVISDCVCPWCYVGKRRLDRALAQVADRYEVRVVWNPFQLAPDLPAEGKDWDDYVRERFGSPERLQAMQAQIVEIGKEVGIPFAFEKIERAANTFDAHRMIFLAGLAGKQHEVVEGLFRAYFVEGVDIGSREELVRIGSENGMDEAKLRADLEGGAGIEEVRYGLANAQQIGVQGVPVFIAELRLGVQGAQPEEALLSLFEQAMKS